MPFTRARRSDNYRCSEYRPQRSFWSETYLRTYQGSYHFPYFAFLFTLVHYAYYER